ncbi:MAG: hypothetical protein ACRCX2_20420 [Paraclostridium sp.]
MGFWKVGTFDDEEDENVEKLIESYCIGINSRLTFEELFGSLSEFDGEPPF